MNCAQHHTILQGATFNSGDSYYTVPFPVRLDEHGRLVNVTTGDLVKMEPTPTGDLVPRDFTSCRARMQLRPDVMSPFVLEEFTTEEGSIVIDGARIYDPLSAERTEAMKYGQRPDRGEWTTAIGQLEIIYPDDRVERLATIHWTLDPEVTR